ncbi:formyltransferase [Methylobacterium sp. BTF04]|uniref:formyltransferase n=1 Tax=Methylobacterium sp. BTF04 TaxID=2708300 RepID=UPI0013D0A2F6|nr:formyltransferase [Methylobacterium sp. BTF04]NEU12553.1 formyltransferase [Methylobacterium sp. BTF04]
MAAWVKGGATDAGAAVDAAATLLAAARTPVVAGLCAELSAIRAAYHLADAIGASVDPVAGASLYAELGSLSRTGAMLTTPAEAIGRADTLLIVGNAPWDRSIVQEIAESVPSRGRAAGTERSILSLGGPRNGATRHVAYPAETGGLAISVAHLRAFLKGHLAGEAAYADLAKRLAAAQYGVVLYDPSELGELGVEMLQGMVKDLNEVTRFFALAVSDPFQGRALLQLAAWTTGQAPRVGFGRHVPEHDPWRFDSARQIAAGEVDAALWLASLPAPRPDWLATLPSIAIVGEGSPEAAGDVADIVIAVGVPGESTGGALWNERRSTITYTPPAGQPAELNAAGVIAAIQDRLVQMKGASC